MQFPATQEEIAAEQAGIYACKLRTIDAVLPEILTKKLILDDYVWDDDRYKPILDEISAAMRDHINPDIMRVVFSPNPELYHDLHIPKHWQQLVKVDDKIRRALRTLLEYAYDDDVDHLVLRKKVTGCLCVIVYKLNDQDFLSAVMERVEQRVVKDIRLKRKYWKLVRRS